MVLTQQRWELAQCVAIRRWWAVPRLDRVNVWGGLVD